MRTMDFFKKYSLYALLALGLTITSCDDDDAPEAENLPEIITDVKLIFTPTAGGAAVEASAQDPDGTGVADLVVQGAITLAANTEYELTFEVINALDPNDPEDVLAEDILEEKEEHQLFFSFTNDAFSNPTGDGNIDTAGDDINYNDFDANNNPLGFNTTWTTAGALSGGTFTVRLQHQPDIKTGSTGANDGDTDFNLEFVLNIQ